MATYTSQPDETSGIDTFLHGYSDLQNTNYATDALLQIGELNNTTASPCRTLIKFDLSSLVGANIISATLSLFVSEDYADNARTFRAFRMKRAWVESQATWNIYSTGNNWSTAGGFHSDDCEQTDIGTCDFTDSEAANTEKTFTLTAAKVREWIDGTFTNNGLLIKADTELNEGYLMHSSSSATAGYRPKLVIEYFRGGQFIRWSNE